MEKYKGIFLREEEEIFDPALRQLMGDRYHDGTQEAPEKETDDANESAGEAAPGIWDRVRQPILFAALVCFMGASAHLGLMSELIAVPGMCVCSACFGWNVGRSHG